jgi:hypothetical protein
MRSDMIFSGGKSPPPPKPSPKPAPAERDQPAPEDEYGGGDIVSPEPSDDTDDDKPLR